MHGEQDGSSYNGHLQCVCYRPLFCLNQYGDCEGAMLRPGHVHSAHDWKQLLQPVVVRYRDSGLRKHLRADAAFASPEGLVGHIGEDLEAFIAAAARNQPGNRETSTPGKEKLEKPVDMGNPGIDGNSPVGACLRPRATPPKVQRESP